MKRVFKNLENHQCIPYAETTNAFIRSLKKYSSRDTVPSMNQQLQVTPHQAIIQDPYPTYTR